MKITSQCKSCQKTLAVGVEHAGKKIRCPVCQAIVQLPESRSNTPLRQRSSSPERPEAPVRRRPARREEPPQRPARRRRESASGTRSEQRNSSRRRPLRQVDPENIWDQPLSSQGAPIPESSYEAYGLPPRKKKKKKREQDDEYRSRSDDRPSRASSSESMNPILVCFIACAGSIALAILGAVVGQSSDGSVNVLAMPAVAVGALLNLGGSLKILANAFEEGLICAFLYLFLPFYALFFLLSRWHENGTAFIVAAFGAITFFVGAAAMAATGS